jgi:hypothetical protein
MTTPSTLANDDQHGLRASNTDQPSSESIGNEVTDVETPLVVEQVEGKSLGTLDSVQPDTVNTVQTHARAHEY